MAEASNHAAQKHTGTQTQSALAESTNLHTVLSLSYGLQHLEDINREAVGFNIMMAKGTALIYVCGAPLDGHYININWTLAFGFPADVTRAIDKR